MASLWIKERIDFNYMEHIPGCSVKNSTELSIQDFLPSDKEKDYIFVGLVHYFAFRLVSRHPNVFKSINASINVNHPHQFEASVDKKTEEYTGELFTKSESKTEDLISMMTQVQENYVHKHTDRLGNIKCYEKKVLSGDRQRRTVSLAF